jgi:hypothetical protein
MHIHKILNYLNNDYLTKSLVSRLYSKLNYAQLSNKYVTKPEG